MMPIKPATPIVNGSFVMISTTVPINIQNEKTYFCHPCFIACISLIYFTQWKQMSVLAIEYLRINNSLLQLFGILKIDALKSGMLFAGIPRGY